MHIYVELDNVPLLVLANKQDLMNAVDKDELFESLQLDSISRRTIRIAEVSAKTGDGLQDATEIIVRLHQNSKDDGQSEYSSSEGLWNQLTVGHEGIIIDLLKHQLLNCRY